MAKSYQVLDIKRISKVKAYFFTFLLIILISGCEKEEFLLSNPLDPDNPEYIPPQITIISGPSEGEVLTTSSVKFIWEGNSNESILFRHRFNGQWSDWNELESVLFDYLDEGEHIFSAQSKYTNEDTSEIATVNFGVNAVEGPALLFNPRRHNAAVGEKVSFHIMAEEVENLTGVELNIRFDVSNIKIESVSTGEMFQGNVESIFHSEIDNEEGKVYLLSGILGGESPSITGTSSIAVIIAEVLSSGKTDLLFDGSESFRDPDNSTITISDAIGGVVFVE